jgi:hypothetical protein
MEIENKMRKQKLSLYIFPKAFVCEREAKERKTE